jgi:hypothetical protein
MSLILLVCLGAVRYVGGALSSSVSSSAEQIKEKTGSP